MRIQSSLALFVLILFTVDAKQQQYIPVISDDFESYQVVSFWNDTLTVQIVVSVLLLLFTRGNKEM